MEHNYPQNIKKIMAVRRATLLKWEILWKWAKYNKEKKRMVSSFQDGAYLLLGGVTWEFY